jgi:ERF superfamily protein
MTTAQTDTLWAALAAFQAEMPTVPKTKTATVRTKDQGSYQYSYADLADISAAAMPLLARFGLSFSCSPEITERGQVLHGCLFHSSGDSLRGTLAINGQRPQEVGSALTYARRYLLGCLTGIVTDADDDGQLAQQAGRKRAAAKPAAAGPTQTVRRKPRAAAGAPVDEVQLPAEGADWNDPWPVIPDTGQVQPPGVIPHAAPQVAPSGPDSEPGAPGLNDSLRRSLMSATSRVGIDPSQDRDTRLALWSALLARRVGSANELAGSEGLTLLRRLNDVETGAVEWDYDVQLNAVKLRHIDRDPDDYRPSP